MIVDGDAFLLMIEPRGAVAGVPVIDQLTRRMAAALRGARHSDHVTRGTHTATGSYPNHDQPSSDDREHLIACTDGIVRTTNSLAVHYLAYFRTEVPAAEFAKLEALPLDEADPTDDELWHRPKSSPVLTPIQPPGAVNVLIDAEDATSKIDGEDGEDAASATFRAILGSLATWFAAIGDRQRAALCELATALPTGRTYEMIATWLAAGWSDRTPSPDWRREAERAGKIQALSTVLAARGIGMTAGDRERVEGASLDLIEGWILRAATASTVDQVLEPSEAADSDSALAVHVALVKAE